MTNTLKITLLATITLLLAACQNTKTKAIDQWLANYQTLIELVEAKPIETLTADELLADFDQTSAHCDSIFEPLAAQNITEADLNEAQGLKVNELNDRWTTCLERYNNRTDSLAQQFLAEQAAINNEE